MMIAIITMYTKKAYVDAGASVTELAAELANTESVNTHQESEEVNWAFHWFSDVQIVRTYRF